MATLHLFRVDGYEKGRCITSAVVVAEDSNDAISLVYANHDLTTVLVDIDVKLLGIAISGVERQIVLNTAN
jgi:hypothetical protein